MTRPKTTLPLKVLLICILIATGSRVVAQRTMPEVLETGTLQEQLDYLDERTRIYNDFRAIREDMFQKIKSNSIDSLEAQKIMVSQLDAQLQSQLAQIEQLQETLQNTNTELETAIKNRDRLSFLGIPMQKGLYNTILWAVVAGLAFITGVLFLSNKRLLNTSRIRKKDLEDTKEEFEAYRKQARERNEQLVVKHHNEIRKLKGK